MSEIEVELISEWYVRPKHEVEESKRRYFLSPCDLSMLILGYAQYGHLFIKPPNFSPLSFLDKFKLSLSSTLAHFYPLAGQLVIQTNLSDHSSCIYVDCYKGPGAKVIHATALHLSIDDVASPDSDIPEVVQSLFDHSVAKSINHDGHTKPLLSVQVTELSDGVFIGTCINHCVADGTSSFHFLNIWSQIFISHEPSYELPILDGNLELIKSVSAQYSAQMAQSESPNPEFFQLPDDHLYNIIKLPYIEPDEFIIRLHEDGHMRERMFHFSTTSMTKLKAKANTEAFYAGNISSFQALSALVWRCVTRARRLCPNERTNCGLVANLRPRFDPPLSPAYFGNFLMPARVSAEVGVLLSNSLGWAALLLHRAVMGLDDEVARRAVVESPKLLLPGLGSHGPNPVLMAGSPRIEFYGPEFGLGKAVAVRMGYEEKDGIVNTFPGAKSDGSVDLQVCLAPHTMNSLLLDQEFVNFAAPTLI